MKIAELKSLLKNHSEEQLVLVITEIYKAIPKAIKESKDIDSIIRNPDKFIESKKKSTKRGKIIDIELLKIDTEDFIEFATNQYYLVPNQFVSKKERPKWRFIVKRLYKEILLSAQNESNLEMATGLLEKLYNLMCYSCRYVIFNSYDSFESIGIEQKEFFSRVLFLKYKIESKKIFINNALNLMNSNGVNRYTLHSTLMEVILSFLKTTDLLGLAIDESKKLLQIEKEKPVSKSNYNYSQYNKEHSINNLTEFGFLCYAKLFEMDNAIEFFKQNYITPNEEIKLYILLSLLFSSKQKDYFIREYKSAVNKGIRPREALKKMYKFTIESGDLPEFFG